MSTRPLSPAAIQGCTGVCRLTGLTCRGDVQVTPPLVDEANMTRPGPVIAPLLPWFGSNGYSAQDMYRPPLRSMATTTKASTVRWVLAIRTCTSCQFGFTASPLGVVHASATVAAVFVPDDGPRQYAMT